MIRIQLPHHLRSLVGISGEVAVEVADPPTLDRALDALETAHPVLRGAIRDRETRQRRAFIRFFAGGRDLSHDPTDASLPLAVAGGIEPLKVVGAMAGG